MPGILPPIMSATPNSPTAPFRRERVRASHQAMGVPMTTNISVADAANFIVSHFTVFHDL